MTFPSTGNHRLRQTGDLRSAGRGPAAAGDRGRPALPHRPGHRRRGAESPRRVRKDIEGWSKETEEDGECRVLCDGLYLPFVVTLWGGGVSGFLQSRMSVALGRLKGLELYGRFRQVSLISLTFKIDRHLWLRCGPIFFKAIDQRGI